MQQAMRPFKKVSFGAEGAETLIPQPRLAFDHIDRQAAFGGFLVFALHVAAGFAHGGDDLVEGDEMAASYARNWCMG